MTILNCDKLLSSIIVIYNNNAYGQNEQFLFTFQASLHQVHNKTPQRAPLQLASVLENMRGLPCGV